jgi:hypothetical protein
MSDTATDLRCASWSRVANLDPVGTAGAHRGFLAVDLPLPWPADIGEHGDVAPLAPVLAGTGVRVQGRVPLGGEARVTLYRFAGAGDPRMTGREAVVDAGPGRLRSVVEDLLAGGGDPVDADRREVLLCTHGRRDACCGARGAVLHLAVAAAAGAAGVAVRRTSHTGGHRFAPTAIVLPEATGWAYLDADRLAAVLGRHGPVRDLLGCYRGWTGLGAPALQALERAVLAEVGWDLLDRPRHGGSLGGDRWSLTVTGPGGATTEWTAEVRPGRRVPRPDCGAPVEGATKEDVELVVADLRSSRP